VSLSFGSLVLFIGFFVTIYSVFYIKEADRPWFLGLLHFFTLAMLGVIFSNNLLAIFVFWELTTLCSYFLICFKSESEEARKAAQTSLVLTVLGGLSLLGGFLILGFMGGSFDLSLIKIPLSDSYYGVALLLIFLGVFTKAAQFPFHFWLPRASTAPTPATAYLHSATMVQAGVFLLFRLSPLLSIHHYWSKILFSVGLFTSVISSIFIFFEKDLKKIFAYTTLSALGMSFFLLGKKSELLEVVLVWVVAHALYKAPLFLLVGSIDNSAKTRDLNNLSNQVLSLRGSLLPAILGLFALWGLPPALSFSAKNLIFTAKNFSVLESSVLVFILAASASVGFSLAGVLFSKKNFMTQESFWKNEKDPCSLWVTLLLSLLPVFALGVFKLITGHRESSFSSEIGSLVGILFLGFIFSKIAQKLREIRLPEVNFIKAWDVCFEAFLKSCKAVFSFLLNSRIELYLFTSFVFLFFLISQISGLDLALPLLTLRNPSLTPFEIGLVVTMIFASILAVRADSTFYSVISLGIIGLATAFIYLANAAPDLALVQILVETVFLIILVLALGDMPKKIIKLTSRYNRILFFIISLGIGLFVGIFTFIASVALRPQTLSRYFGENSLSLAQARNVVNAIVVDFRGLDTLGEIIVFGVSVLAIINFLKPSKSTEEIS
jgi:multicomponent Na+:H+ antiporter subunit A